METIVLVHTHRNEEMSHVCCIVDPINMYLSKILTTLFNMVVIYPPAYQSQ